MRRFFEWFSVPLIVIPVSLILFWLLIDASSISRRWFLVFFLNVVILPLSAIIWLEKRRFISDLDLRNKRERLAFLGLTFLVSSINFVNSVILSAPKVIQSLNFLILFLIVIISSISVFWKISIHMMVLSSVITVAFLAKGSEALWWLLILPPVAFHRLYFKHHNFSQVLVGTILGFLISFLTIKFLGLS